MTICIVDTSILCELLNLPGKAEQHDAVLASFVERQEEREQFLLPLAVLFETANHIAQLKTGGVRRQRAETFIDLAEKALAGDSPFAVTPFPDADQVRMWMKKHPDDATRGVGLADRSLIALWEEQTEIHSARRVYIWSLDGELSGYDR